MISLNSFCDFKDFSCPSYDVKNRQNVSLLNSPSSSLSAVICGIGVSVKHVDGCFLVASLSLRGSAWQSKCIAVGNRLLAINGQ
jgi:C-terminal processing protease CtpA/Prc